MTRLDCVLPAPLHAQYRKKGKRKIETRYVQIPVDVSIEVVDDAEIPDVVRSRRNPIDDIRRMAHVEGRGLFTPSRLFGSIESLSKGDPGSFYGSPEHYPLATGDAVHRSVSPFGLWTLQELRGKEGAIDLADGLVEETVDRWRSRIEDAFVVARGKVWQKLGTFPVIETRIEPGIGDTFIAFQDLRYVRQERDRRKPRMATHSEAIHRVGELDPWLELQGIRRIGDHARDFEFLDVDVLESHAPSRIDLVAGDIERSILYSYHFSAWFSENKESLRPDLVAAIHTLIEGPEGAGAADYVDAAATISATTSISPELTRLSEDIRPFVDRWQAVGRPLHDAGVRSYDEDMDAVTAPAP